jgi:hypothetical protein
MIYDIRVDKNVRREATQTEESESSFGWCKGTLAARCCGVPPAPVYVEGIVGCLLPEASDAFGAEAVTTGAAP